ncbi:hypothetical protein ACP0AK_06790 [Listeria ivanovii]|uniref:YokE-like PH domain-containing protein n=1 Tax=Listeria ivanovii (strain ATCC BAA-678 / PAM 55) TaxID=881621 RepID=G2ZBG2_LISIP|nr:hypothetical protein [Listeria ivanovii]AHI56293.1 hypothetical protein AX25_09450 [Listeria ivanovii WSLC3009]AIS65718.1 hypothetical protein JL52_09290 [Listeria ivanovii subsp. ivanovii]MBC1759251.1 hypothetical protein [Listeria ivanovii]MBK3914272.1 hypothetical protein [Listeria ivanovii subsp. ivanovii]MBK3920890.1 hypothetical protein [Listeria ivanovii subsp. ivanovii]
MYETMIAKAGARELLGMNTSLIYGSFSYRIEGELMELDGLWISNEDAFIFYLENEEIYLLKKFAYEEIQILEQKISIVSMTKKLILKFKNKESYTLLVANGEAKVFANSVNERIQKVSQD